MKLYHGTNVDFEEIDLDKSKPNKDFGRGFYLSPDYQQALGMEHTKVRQHKEGRPTVQTYEISDASFKELRILRFDNYSKEWARFILANRNNKGLEPIHDYDVVIGPIADDNVGIQLWFYEKEFINLDTLVKRLQFFRGLTIQYFFGTPIAIRHLKRII